MLARRQEERRIALRLLESLAECLLKRGSERRARLIKRVRKAEVAFGNEGLRRDLGEALRNELVSHPLDAAVARLVWLALDGGQVSGRDAVVARDAPHLLGQVLGDDEVGTLEGRRDGE